MTEVKIIAKGYVKKLEGKILASSNVVLIRFGVVNIIVDPGMDKEALLSGLKREGLTPRDIHYVVLTHYHLDHILLAGIFENAKIVDKNSIYSFKGEIEKHHGKIPGTDIEILSTPGHDPFHCSVIVKTDQGVIAIVGDVFWWWSNEEQKTSIDELLKHEDLYAKDKAQLLESRKKILALADFIIPGHGEMFRVEK